MLKPEIFERAAAIVQEKGFWVARGYLLDDDTKNERGICEGGTCFGLALQTAVDEDWIQKGNPREDEDGYLQFAVKWFAANGEDMAAAQAAIDDGQSGWPFIYRFNDNELTADLAVKALKGMAHALSEVSA